MIVIFDPDHDAAVELRAAVALRYPGIPVTTTEALDAFLQLHRSTRTVVLGPTLRTTAALELADRLKNDWPQLTNILVRHGVDDAMRLHSARAGLSAVVEVSDTTSLLAAVQDGLETDRDWGQVITVFSTKGGVGKTTLAVNLATVLTEGGARDVVLVDLDYPYGDVATVLHLNPTSTLADAAPQRGHVRIDALRPLLHPSLPGLSVLAAPATPAGAARIHPMLVVEVIHELRRNVDHVVVDTPAGFDDQVLAALDLSDRVALVASPDLTALKSLSLAQETMRLLGYTRERQRVVLNRADGRGGLSHQVLERLLGATGAARIPDSDQVGEAGNLGMPIAAAHPGHPVSTAIRRFVEEDLLAGRPAGAAADVSPTIDAAGDLSDGSGHDSGDGPGGDAGDDAGGRSEPEPAGAEPGLFGGPRDPDELTRIDVTDESTGTRRRGGWFGLLRPRGQ